MTHRRNPRKPNGQAGPQGRANSHPPASAEQDAILRGRPAAASEDAKDGDVPPGEKPLPADASEFVEEIHGKIDLTGVWRGLLRASDEKIKQRAVEKLTEMRYKGAAALADPPTQIVIDIDSAVARRAAEGAKK